MLTPLLRMAHRNVFLAKLVLVATALIAAPATAQAVPEEPVVPGLRQVFVEPVTPEEAERASKKHSAPVPDGAKLTAHASLAGPPEAPASVTELARALKHDPVLIYEYVHNNIEYLPVWGGLKGQVGTLLDGQSTSFDIAQLTADLLNASSNPSQVATLVRGTIRINATQAASWLGIPLASTSLCGLYDIFSSAGIPSALKRSSGSTTTDCSLAVNLDIGHVWVKLVKDSITYELDPSFKAHSVKTGIADLAAVLGYNQSAYTGVGCSGATCTASRVANINRTGLLSETPSTHSLPNYSRNLLTYLKTNKIHDLADAVGGASIVPTDATTLPSVLPYTVVSRAADPFTITGNYKTALTVRIGPTSTPDVNERFMIDEIYGKRLTIFFNSSREPELRLDGQFVAKGAAVSSGASVSVQLRACHPWGYSSPDCSTSSPDYGPNQHVNVTIKEGGYYLVASGWGPVGPNMVNYRQQQLSKANTLGLAADSEPVMGSVLSVIATNWIAQTNRSADLLLRMGGAWTTYFHQVGIAGHQGGPFVDLPGNTATFVPLLRSAGDVPDEAKRAQVFFDTAMHLSILESSAVQQVADVSAVSSAKLIDLNMALAIDNDVLNIASCAEYNFLKTGGYLSAYGSDTVNGSIIKSIKDTFCNSDGSEKVTTARYILPRQKNISETWLPTPRWTGTGYYRISGTGGTAIAAMISGNYAGGFAGTNQAASATRKFASVKSLGLPNIRSWVADPVDSYRGDYLYDQVDIVTGAGSFPAALSFARSYNSGQATNEGVIGRGWTHNLDIKSQVTSDGFQSFGADNAWNAAEVIAERYVSLDLLADPAKSLQNIAIATVGHRWIGDKLVHNMLVVTNGGSSTAFTKLADGTYNPPPTSNARAERNGSGIVTFTSADGTQVGFGTPDTETRLSRAATLTDPAGLVVRFTYDGSGQLTSVANSFGRGLTLGWASGKIASVTEQLASGTPRSVGFTYVDKDLSRVTDTRLNVSLFCYDSEGLMTRHYTPTLRPVDNNCASGTPYIRNVYDTLGRVKQQLDGEDHVTDFYLAGYRTELVSDPAGLGIRAVQYQNGLGQVIAKLEPRTGTAPITTGSSKATTTLYDGLARPVRVTFPEGNAIETSYDVRSNVLQTCLIPKVAGAYPACNTGGGTTHIASKSAFVEGENVLACSNPKTCNKPSWTADAALANTVGNKTDFSYNSNGTVATVEGPAPSVGATRPKTTYAYTSVTAGSDSVSLLTSETARITGDANTVVTQYAYDNTNRFALKDATVDPSGLALKTSYVNDTIGNVTSVDGPRTDVVDITSYTYDAARNVTEEVAPNPGSGSPTTRSTFDADGRLVATAGKIGSQWLTTCTGYTKTAQVAYEAGPSTTSTASDCSFVASTSVSRIDRSYDAADREFRVTVANETGARITRLDRLADGKVWREVSAEGTAAERAEETAYTDNGTVQSVTDGNGNMTTYTYDGFDRLIRQNYPNASGGGVSTADVVAYAYDPRGLVTRRSLRGNSDVSGACTACIAFSYDALGQLTVKDAPGSADIAYDYDLLGRPAGVRLTATSPSTPEVGYSWDKAGRLLSRVAYGRTLSYAYVDGNFERTSLTLPGSVVTYSCYDAVGRVTKLKSATNCGNNTGLIASYAYDDLSRRSTVTLGNGVVTNLTYTGVGDLHTYGHVFSGGPGNITWTQAYNRAGQVTSSALSNTAWLWNGHYNLDRTATPNGLNQLTPRWGNRALAYDTAGNLTREGASTFAYDAENRLTGAQTPRATVSYAYDVEGQLMTRASSAASGTRTYLYDGTDIVAEYDGTGAVVRRYVHGPGIDEPVLVYEGSGTGTQRYLFTDPQGSVAARADASGVVSAVYSYGPYGEPAGPDGELYRYTGQTFDPDTGLYNYKARAYSSRLGRFLQTDPIGYEDDLNLYAYVAGDPINLADPSGMAADSGRQAASQAWSLTKSGVNTGLHAIASFNLGSGHDPRMYSGVYGSTAPNSTFYELGQSSQLFLSNYGYAMAMGGRAGPRPTTITSANLTQRASNLAKAYGKNRVTLRSPSTKIEIDLAGRAHAGIATPHVKVSPRNLNAPKQPAYNTTGSKVKAATLEYIRMAERFLGIKP